MQEKRLHLCHSHLTYIAEHQELARRSRASEELMKEQVVEAKAIVEEEKLCKREVAFGNLSLNLGR